MKPETLLTIVVVLLVGAIVLAVSSCAPKGYIDGQTACELELSQTKDELSDVRMKQIIESIVDEDVEE